MTPFDSQQCNLLFLNTCFSDFFDGVAEDKLFAMFAHLFAEKIDHLQCSDHISFSAHGGINEACKNLKVMTTLHLRHAHLEPFVLERVAEVDHTHQRICMRVANKISSHLLNPTNSFQIATVPSFWAACGRFLGSCFGHIAPNGLQNRT